MEIILNQTLLNWNVVSNYFYIISPYTFSEGCPALPTDVQWEFINFFLILIADKSQNEDIDDAQLMSSQTTDLGMHYVLYAWSCSHAIVYMHNYNGVHLLQLYRGNYLVWKSAVKQVWLYILLKVSLSSGMA